MVKSEFKVQVFSVLYSKEVLRLEGTKVDVTDAVVGASFNKLSDTSSASSSCCKSEHHIQSNKMIAWSWQFELRLIYLTVIERADQVEVEREPKREVCHVHVRWPLMWRKLFCLKQMLHLFGSHSMPWPEDFLTACWCVRLYGHACRLWEGRLSSPSRLFWTLGRVKQFDVGKLPLPHASVFAFTTRPLRPTITFLCSHKLEVSARLPVMPQQVVATCNRRQLLSLDASIAHQAHLCCVMVPLEGCYAHRVVHVAKPKKTSRNNNVLIRRLCVPILAATLLHNSRHWTPSFVSTIGA